MTSSLNPVHVCIATGQNAANLIPLEQYDAREVLILQTPTMRENAGHLALALRREGRTVKRQDFDDSSPRAMSAGADAIAEQLDGRHVILHATGGTKLMVLAMRDGLRLVEAGEGRLDILYAETRLQQIDWLGQDARTDAMGDVLNLTQMLQVQGYRIDGDSRHAQAQQRAATRNSITREMGDNAQRYGRFFSALATLASRAAESSAARDLTQHFSFAPGGSSAELLRKAQDKGLLTWDGEEAVTFADKSAASYFAGGWLEEFVLLKLTGLVKPERFSSNLQVLSATNGVPNEIDAMVVHRNRALLIECKTGKQTAKAQDALYKLAQLRDRLAGSVGSALYLSAQTVGDEVLARAKEYKVEVLHGAEVGQFVPWLKKWLDR